MNLSRHIARFLFSILLLTSISTGQLHARQNSVLSEGFWVKMSFSGSGVYKIDRSTLAAMGFDINAIDPRNIQIYGIKGGMLPQANNAYTSLSLQELAISVEGEADGTMGPDDYVLFYVDGPDEIRYTGQSYQVVKNLYADQVHYFITVATTQGRRIGQLANISGDHPVINTYDRLISHEEDLFNIIGSGREWYGEQFTTEDPLNFEIDLTNLSTESDILLSVTAMSQAFIGTSMSIELGGQDAGHLNFSTIPDTRYGIKGNEQSRVIRVDPEDFGTNPSTTLALTFNKNGQSNAIGYLNRFVVELPTNLAYNNNPYNFRSKASLAQSLSNFSLTIPSNETQVWDVTDPISPAAQEYTLNGNQASFGAFTNTLHEYTFFASDDVPIVSEYQQQSTQNLSGMSVPDLLIVTNDFLKPQAERLANFRRTHDGLEVVVATTAEIYNEFAAGRQDISAIRNIARSLNKRSNRFQYLLFFGKGSFDYKDRIENNSNFVPTYEARNSLHPLLSFSSDDFFGFLGEDEGLWAESASGDHLLDIGIGRIPATTLEQATIAVDKIISYQTDPQSLGEWRSRLVFVADDGDRNIHQRDADQLATLIDTTYKDYNVSKLYLDAFEQELRPNGEFSPQAVNALLDQVDKGALIINFTGHGAETGWMQERVLTTALIDDWNNSQKLPLLVTATCEFGRNDDPTIFSGAEKMMFKSDGGALALITTARPVFSSTNYDLNLALYGSILEPKNGEYPRLGDIIQFTKNNSLRGSLNRNFVLLGDPSMRIAYPENQIRLETINGQPILVDEPDTLKALQRVNITGQVESNNQLLSNFNGIVNFNLFDKNNNLETKGTESDVFEFTERNSTLFSGTATVVNGRFQIEFVIPKNINYQFGNGKMTFYAVEEQADTDALGASLDFYLGGTDFTANADNLAPQIRAFLNDTSQVETYYIKPDADLVLLLDDESGINISKSGIGQDITAVLNDSASFVLNDFYSTRIDDFSKGIVTFPMRNLPLGWNQLEISAWDTHNNLSSTTLDFFVTDENSNTISEINAYPNPFINNMTFSVTHNNAGQAIELVVEIFNQKGEKVTSIYQATEEAGNVVQVLWDGTDNTGSNLPAGVYIYNILLRSENTEIIHSTRQKLIISN